MKAYALAQLVGRGVIIGAGAVLGAGMVVAWTGPTGTAPNANVSAPLNVSGTAQTKTGQLWANGQLYINNTSPTVYMVDSDHRSAMIHNNSNILYFLRGSGTGSTGWTAYNGYWPLTLNLETNAAAFGGAISTPGTITATGNIDTAGTIYAARLYTDNATYLPHTNGYNYLRGHTYFNGVLYDENNTQYYVDPSSYSSLNVVYTNALRGYGDWGNSGPSISVAGDAINITGTSYVDIPNLPTGGGHFMCWGTTNGRLKRQSGACNTSDARLKEHIKPIQAGLAEILKLNPVTFEWKKEAKAESGTKLGLIAQEVKEIIPEVITGTGTGVEGDWYGIDYTALAAPMIKAIQELKAENDELRARIEKLESKN